MEALSGVASGMAVASLSIQLIESIGKIKTFIHNFKDAQKELERLVDLLERLGALLEDVHALMEQQASLQAQHFPKPSMTIFKCLNSCEKTLEPLQSIIKDCTPSKSKMGTGMDRLKYGLRVAFKAKDIEGFETRIEREISFLHASLGANCGAILMQLGPALLSTRHIDEPMHQDPTAPSISIAHTKGLSSTPENTMVSHPVATRSSLSRTYVRSPLERIGIYRQRIVQRTPCSSRSRITDHEEEGGTIVSEHEETTIVWRMLGYGLTWIQHHSFGISMPSLSTFPVIKYFPDEIRAGLRTGEVHDFQDMFRRGVVHPFARDCDGFSLLHFAAMFGRADIYLLLRDLGVQQSLTKYESSPLLFAFEGDIHTEKSDRTTLCRCVFFDTTLVDDFTCSKWQSPQYPRGDTKPCQWLYSQASQVLPYEDSIAMKLKIIKDEWFKDCADLEKTGESAKRIFNFNPDADIMDYIQRGRCSLLTHTILFTDRPYDSYLLGSMLIEWLLKAGIDVELFMDYECQHLRPIESVRDPDSPWDFYKVVMFNGSKESGWVLGFEYELSSKTPGYLVVSEYQALSIEIQRGEKWPFLNIDHHFWRWDWEEKCYERRFQRRMEAKARKERARTGQKIRKSKMPGMWVW